MSLAKRHLVIAWVAVLALGALIVTVGGCAEKIEGPGATANITVQLGAKAGPRTSYLLTVFADDFDTLMVPMTPAAGQVVASLTIPSGADRHFRVEARDVLGTVLYRGDAVRNVSAFQPLDLTIAMAPVVPMLYLTPHFDQVALGDGFSFTIRAHGLTELTGVDVALALAGFQKRVTSAIIDTVELPAEQVERGTTLAYDPGGDANVFITLSNSNPVVDAGGDAALVVVRCRTQDTWAADADTTLEPEMSLEALRGTAVPLDSLYLDTAQVRITRQGALPRFIGTSFFDEGAALVPVGAGETILAGTLADTVNDAIPQLFLARLGDDSGVVSTQVVPWFDGEITTGFASGTTGGSYACGRADFGTSTLLRLDAAGEEKWRENLAQRGLDSAWDLVALPGGGCVVVGSYDSGDSGGLGYAFVVYDENGYVADDNASTFGVDSEALAVVALNDTTFVLAGYEQGFESLAAATLRQYSLSGEYQQDWVHQYGGDANAMAHAVVRAGNGFLVVGSADPAGSGLGDVYVVRTDVAGVPLWTRTFGGAADVDEGLCVTAAPDGGFVIAGSTLSRRFGQDRDVLLLKIDVDGNLIWQNTVGGADDDVPHDIVPTANGYLVTGSSAPGPRGGSDILILPIGPDGQKSTP